MSDSQRRVLDNTFIQAIIVKTDGSSASLDSIYQVFERLNSGGTQLTGHEIRVALYAGELIGFLSGVNQINEWRGLYGAISPRLRDQELVLRIMAFFVSPGTYKRPMKKFLNDFAANNRDCANLDKSHLTSLFLNACQLFLNAPGPSAFRHQSKQINVALTEAVMVALMRRLEAGDPLPTPEGISSALFAVSKNEKFIESITRATADEEGVKYRLAYATKLFGAA